MFKRLAAVAIVAAVAIGTTACSTNTADKVEVTGDFGTAAAATVNGDLDVSSVASKVLINGDGDELASDGNAEIGLELYDPTNQKDLIPYSTSYSLSEVTSSILITDQLTDKKMGSRVVITGSASDIVGSGNASTYFSLDDTSPLVVVVDLIEPVQTTDPELSDTFTDADFPTVTFDDSGNSTTTITTGVTPSTTQIKVLSEGDGATVASGDTVGFYYQLTRLRDGKEIESNFGSGTPASSTADSSGLITGFVTALVGQKVGSTVLAVVPPSEAYGSSDGNALQHEALVFVLKIDSTAATAAQ